MIFPSVCMDGFFNNPEEIIDYANTLEYLPDGYSPGFRSKPLHELNFNFFNNICIKQLAVLFPNNVDDLSFQARCRFQKVPANYKFTDWIHTDDTSVLTTIIYLTNECNAGTSIYKKNLFKNEISTDIKYDYYKQMTNNKLPENKMKELEKIHKEHVKSYEETISFKGIYNRFIAFDASSYHSAQSYMANNEKDRLTLITFFDYINNKNLNLKFSISESRKR